MNVRSFSEAGLRMAPWLLALVLVGITGCSTPIVGTDAGRDAPAAIDAGTDAPEPPDAPVSIDAPDPGDAPVPTDAGPPDGGPPPVTTPSGLADFSCAPSRPATGGLIDVTVRLERFLGGGPVSGATVQVFPEEDLSPATCTGLCVTGVTDTSGRAIVPIPPSSFGTARILAFGTYVETLHSHVPSPAAPGEVVLPAYLSSTVDLVYSGLGRTRSAGAMLTGVVEDCAGNTVGEATVRVFRADGTEVLSGPGATDPLLAYINTVPTPALMRTNTSGAWVMGNVPADAASERFRIEAWGTTGGAYRRLACETVLGAGGSVGDVRLGPLRATYPAGHPCN